MKNEIEIIDDRANIITRWRGEEHKVVIDADDLSQISICKKIFLQCKKSYYQPIAYFKGNKCKTLSRFIINAPQGLEVHHKDRNPFNNCKSNLLCLEREEHERIHKYVNDGLLLEA